MSVDAPREAGLFGIEGVVAVALGRVDWASTGVGGPEGWPQSLQTAVRIMLTSRFPMWMGWGPDLTFFCNDAYRRDTLGVKFPWALGRSAREVWAEIWDDIGPRIDAVTSTGAATWDEALLLFLQRSGFVEETYHTFSYSPLADDEGAIAGMFCVVSEDTLRVIGERRLATIRALGADPSAVRTEEEVARAVERSLADNPKSLPFTLLYLLPEEGGGDARLVAVTGVPPGHPMRAGNVPVAGGPWPFDGSLGEPVLVEGLERWGDLPTGAWEEPPNAAAVVPVPHQGSDRPLGFLVAGLNRYRPYDEDYRAFLALIAAQIGGAIATARAYEAERRRAEALAELDRAKTEFFTNISHEFRTPLTLLLGPVEDALADRDAVLAPAQHRRLQVVLRNAQRLLKLVNSLLDFSRVESGRTQARFEPVDLGEVTAELASMFESAFDRAGLELRIERGPLPGPVNVDREMWAKVVLNLLSNALKYTFEGGATVRVHADGGRAVVEVADTGIGVSPAEQGRLFERFHRVVGARSRTHEGSGIGLALAAELVALHGGTITAESELHRGTTFRVAIPFGTAHLPENAVASEPAMGADAERRTAEGFLAEALRWFDGGATEADEGPGSGARVLVVDDNADMRDYITSLLSDTYRVSTAVDGLDALTAAVEQPPDIVLSDVMMPNLDGFGLLAALRAEPATAGVPVIMLSARAGEDGVIEGLEAGADDYLVKPFSARELRARVRANLELDRSKRIRDQLERNRSLLAQAQHLAGIGSWEMDLVTGSITPSPELVQLVGLSEEELDSGGIEHVLARRVHPDDVELVRSALEAGARGEPVDLRVRFVFDDDEVRTFRTLGTLELDELGAPVRLRGSHQDITEQLAAEAAVAAAAAEREAAAREHSIAEELQRSLLPTISFDPDHLEVATFYRAGDEGARVGGDWYDVIELGAGRTALVLGDVMGRGVRAAAVMGQLRSAVRAYSRLDLPPADVLEFLDGVVQDLGTDHIVTCVYGVYDPADGTFTYASAGHLPPIVGPPDGHPYLLVGSGPPLGAGASGHEGRTVRLPAGSVIALYTDGLVERRDRDLDSGISRLVDALAQVDVGLDELPARLVRAAGEEAVSDDVAVLVARVDDSATVHVLDLDLDEHSEAVGTARNAARAHLGTDASDCLDDVLLALSELVTNALLHGAPPVRLLMRSTPSQVVVEVHDRSSLVPRRMRPGQEDEHGRGMQLVDAVTDRWGTRPTPEGKVVWFVVRRPR